LQEGCAKGHLLRPLGLWLLQLLLQEAVQVGPSAAGCSHLLATCEPPRCRHCGPETLCVCTDDGIYCRRPAWFTVMSTWCSTRLAPIWTLWHWWRCVAAS